MSEETEEQATERDRLIEEWLASKRGNWDEDEIEAAEAGIDYVLDMYASDPEGLEDFDGCSEAFDMADGIIERKQDRERIAEYVYEGMQAAKRAIRDGAPFKPDRHDQTRAETVKRLAGELKALMGKS